MPVLSRRSFLKTAGIALAGTALPRRGDDPDVAWPSGPGVRLGRAAGPGPARVLSRPGPHGNLVRWLQPDDVAVILREVVGRGLLPHNHVWFELEDGYAYSSYLQPVLNLPNTPLTTLPAGGVWTEVSIPYVDALAGADPAREKVYRLYYSSVFKITEILSGFDGAPWYRVYDENGSRMFAPAEAFRPIPAEELTPLSPEAEEKHVEVHLEAQTLAAFEGEREVFHTRIASGAFFFGADGRTLVNGTPGGPHPIWSKRISRHMAGGTLESGYDLPGVGWVAYFAANGAAIHSTYWHNDFGTPKSHGCLNCRPEDAKWLFRWTLPQVPYQPGDITVQWSNRGTTVDILTKA